jgi:hypothetical protein
LDGEEYVFHLHKNKRPLTNGEAGVDFVLV